MAFGEAAYAEAAAVTADGTKAKKMAAPIAPGRPNINNLEGTKMHYQLSSDDLEVEIIELLAQYDLGHWEINHSSSGRVEATIYVDERFTGDQVRGAFTDSGRAVRWIIARGVDMCEAMRNVRNAFVEAAPAEKAA